MRYLRIGETELPVMYGGISPFSDRFKTQIYYGDRSIVQVAEILDGNNGFDYVEDDKTEHFDGFSKLIEIAYVDDETMVAFLQFVEKQIEEYQEKTGGD